VLVFSVVLFVGIIAGCGQTAQPTPDGNASIAASLEPTSNRSTGAPSDTDGAAIPTLPDDAALAPGTYKLAPSAVGEKFPEILVTVPDGWYGRGWLVNRPRADEATPAVSVQFWDVGMIYGHPCHWKGTMRLPGPSADELAEALAEVPLRNATEPTNVVIDGFPGKYLEWSVPTDIEMDDEGNFLECDKAEDGEPYFQSWTGEGSASGRYQQGPGQVDRLWILDVKGGRLVIDAFSMPYATTEEIDELTAIVESIRIEE